MDIYTVETFQYDWRNKKVVSQYVLTQNRRSAKKIVDLAVKEYKSSPNKKCELVMDGDDMYIYRITMPSIEGISPEHEFFIGMTKRHVHSSQDTDELLNQVKQDYKFERN